MKGSISEGQQVFGVEFLPRFMWGLHCLAFLSCMISCIPVKQEAKFILALRPFISLLKLILGGLWMFYLWLPAGSACFEPTSGFEPALQFFPFRGKKTKSKSEPSDLHFQMYLFPTISSGKKHSESLHISQQKVQKRMVWWRSGERNLQTYTKTEQQMRSCLWRNDIMSLVRRWKGLLVGFSI